MPSRPVANPASPREARTGDLEVDPPPTGNPELTPSSPTAEVTPNVVNQSSTTATGVLATQADQASSTRQPLESYAPNLARAREAWSAATEKAAEFDSIFKVNCNPFSVPALCLATECCLMLHE